MRLVRASAIAIAVSALVVPTLLSAQRGGGAMGAPNEDADRVIENGGITAPGWQGKVDAAAARQGGSTDDSMFTQDGGTLHIITGPASSYWNPSNAATGNYTVMATFREPQQDFNHPHPFGLFIGGQNLGTDQQRLTYCTAYRNGSFIVRQFNGTAVTNLVPSSGRGTQPNAAVKTVADPTAEIIQEVGWNVQNGQAECVINGQVVATLTAEQLGGAGASDGVYGIRVAHNVEVFVTNLMKH